jgi:hypothetical protein
MSNTTVQAARPPEIAVVPSRTPLRWALLAALAVLFYLLCERVWNLGVTHTDDAMWVLRSHTSFFSTIDDWAHWQGRLWAYVSGSLIMLALVNQGTLFGELLRLGSFALFFIAFHVVAAAYCGRRIALLCATLFLGLFALKWDGSILTTYPMITWPAGIALAGALMAGRAWTRVDGKRWQLAAAFVLLFCALFNNEGITVTFIALALMSVLTNAVQLEHGAAGKHRFGLTRRSTRLLLVFVAAAAAYSALYFVWRLQFPSTYAGNALAPFSARRILITLYHFSTSGSALHEILSPLKLPYADTFGAGAEISYRLGQFARGLLTDPRALLAGALTAWLLWRQLISRGAPAEAGPVLALPCAIGAGLAIAILPIIPVALVGNYQVWAVDIGVRAYSHTIFAHFGWSLVLAALLVRWFDRLGRGRLAVVLVLVLAVGAGGLAALVFRANDAIALDMRPEAGRWQVANRAVSVNDALFRSDVVWIPGFAQRSQYGQLYQHYWQEYAAARFGSKAEVAVRTPDVNDLARGVVMLDYGYDAAGRRMVSLMMQYRKATPDEPLQGGRLVVDLGAAGVAEHYLLEYRAGAELGRVPVAALAAVPSRPGLYLLDPSAPVDPASVRLLRADAGLGGKALAAIRVPRGVRIDFKKTGKATSFDPAAFLTRGWHAIDDRAVWSRGGEVHLRIPRRLLPAGALYMVLDVASYTSMGFATGLQQMRASVNGAALGQWDFRAGANPDIALDLPVAAQHGDVLDLRFDVAPGMVPKRLGLDEGDERELGIQLRAVTLMPKGTVAR